ncbi:hypothetical protein PARPLA_02510 [Rhodobacteraceae bacterium THAF1]|uniref:TadE/TadG family type IV pilus assembly protein n=1 Tax=Palleronia sp. THAF1 TaxID=2587842 RepID=UPI000F3EDB82|nr:hypothetical protein [Palleronia sp. THAF1]QFU07990.1 hypothetical protein FIU81_04825 [Palleronia sp. THAF1]VDC27841.1 hypothetical protein PARPLA_02510 [Rhodobacteraceae bacterium THAF1]
MRLTNHLHSLLHRFRREETGSFTVEFILALPLLVWGMMISLASIDAYRTQTMNLRITYSLADQISRLEKPIDSAFIDGLGRVYEFLAPSDHDTYLRVTSVYWDATNAEHVIMWSDVARTTSGKAPPPIISQANFNLIEDQIPILAEGDSIIFVETWLDYEPPFTLGLEPRRFDNDVAVAPRWTKIEHSDIST